MQVNEIKGDIKTREYGIDLLRISGMIGIVYLHILNSGGGVLNSIAKYSATYYVLWILNIVCYSSVNVFAMVTGYLYVKREPKRSRLVALIHNMIVWSIVITVGVYFLRPGWISGVSDIVYGVCPPLYWFGKTGGYWYLMSYIFLFCLIPYINILINKLQKDSFKRLLQIIFIFASVIPTFGLRDFFYFNEGYSPFWLIFCYLIGAYVKLDCGEYTGKNLLKTKKKCAVVLLLNTAFVFIVKIAISEITYSFLGHSFAENQLITYISPFILANSICLLLFFKDIRVNNGVIQKAILLLSNSAFSVYIIHCNPLIFNNLISNKVNGFLGAKNCTYQILAVLIIGIVIFLSCFLLQQIYNLVRSILRKGMKKE